MSVHLPPRRSGIRSLALVSVLAASAGTATTFATPTLEPAPKGTAFAGRGGEVAAFRIASTILGEVRRVEIVLPASFARSSPTRRYPVTVVLDGEADLAPVAAVADELTRNGQIPEAILVGIDNVGSERERVRDLTPPGLSVSGSGLEEGGDRFLDFIERELLPQVAASFRGGEPRTLIGHSSGAILATWAAATRPRFRAVVAIDGPMQLQENWLAQKLIARAKASAGPAPALRYASFGARFPWPESPWRELVAAAPPSWRLHAETLRLEAHETAVFLGAYLGLRELFADASRLAAPQSPTTSVLLYYAKLRSELGADLAPPERVLRDTLDDLLLEGNGAAAREARELLVSSYGAPADDADLIARIAAAERLPPLTETVEAMLAAPAPTPEEARAFLGEWRGDIWMSPAQPRTGRTILRLRVIDGKVVAEIERSDAPAEFRLRRVDYLRVTPEGLSFGVLNGMRPRGILLHVGVLTGDVLAGNSRWAGIRMDPPADGAEPGFSFRRVPRRVTPRWPGARR